MMMRLEIAVHAQRGGMGRDLTQQAMPDEETKIVVNRGQGNMRNALAHGGVDLLGRTVTMRGDNSFIDHLALMRGGQAVLPGQFSELRVGKTHSY